MQQWNEFRLLGKFKGPLEIITKHGLCLPFRVRRRSALSGLREVLNSARLVNMR